MNTKSEQTTQQIGTTTAVVISHYGNQSIKQLIEDLLEKESLKYIIHTNDKAS